MPNITKYFYRQYCKSCEDFTLHTRVYCDEPKHELFNQAIFDEGVKFVSICKCNTQYTPVNISDIDQDKIDKQRKRFKEKRTNDFYKMTNILSHIAMPTNFGYSEDIIESDAGLEHVEQIERQKKNAIIEARNVELKRFANVGRNDICLCGSEKKYKKCCLSKHEN